MAKSKRSVVETIIDRMDEARMENEGGYPSDYTFVDISRKLFVAIATTSNHEPDLIFMNVDEFIEEYDYWLD